MISPEILLKDLFKTPESSINNIVTKGSVINFSYIGQTSAPIHDPFPLIIVTDNFINMIRGVNLHYLTVPYMKAMIANRNMAGNNNFSYKTISSDKYIVDAFRSYKKIGMSNVKNLDIQFLKNLLNISSALNIGELDQIREQIKATLEQSVQQASADDLSNLG